MNKKALFIAAIAVGVSTTFAQEETSELIELRKTVRLQEQQLKGINKRLDELGEAPKGEEKSNWSDKIKLKGDFRYRYEYKAKASDTSANRHRIRARIGTYADVNDEVKVGIRLATGSSEGATSTNQDLGGDYEEKKLWLDLAYLTYSPAALDGLDLTFGKMKQPWTKVSDLVFDSDVNPEGIALNYACGNDTIDISTVFGYHVMKDDSNANTGLDIDLLSAQVAADSKLGEDATLTTGVGAFIYNNADKIWATGYDLIDAFAQIELKSTPLPVTLFAEVLNNVASGVDEGEAWMLGIGTKYKKASFAYNYRDLGEDSLVDALDDGDFGGPGGKGHKLKAKYKISKNFGAGVTYFRVNNAGDKGKDVDLVQFDLSAKF